MQSFETIREVNLGPYEVVYYTQACPGPGAVNEDSIGFFSSGAEGLVLIAADGAGGHPKGEEASHCVVNSVIENLESGANKAKSPSLRNSILDGMEAANDELLSFGTGSKTTATICEIYGRKLRTYQVGDSGIIVSGQKGKLKYKTVFHSLAGYGVESGLINEQEALVSSNLNEVFNILGDKEMSIELGPIIDLDDRDTVLVASDGIFDNFSIDELTEIIRAGSIMDSGKQFLQFFSDRLESDPHGQVTKYDDLSFLICRLSMK